MERIFNSLKVIPMILKQLSVPLLLALVISGCAQKKIVVNKHNQTQAEKSDSTKNTEALKSAEGNKDVVTTEPSSANEVNLAQEPVKPPVMSRNIPRFGFIFSGGGAKTWAHIGVLKELQKMKWPIHGVSGFEWGSVVAAIYAENLSANEVEWEMSKLKDFDKSDLFIKAVFDKKSTSDLKIPFVCPSLNLNKQSYFLLNRGQLEQLIPFCLSQPPVMAPHAQSVAIMSDVPSLAQHLRSTGVQKVILVNVLAQARPRSFVKDNTSAENILWAQSAALMSKKMMGVDDVIQINLDDYGIKDIDLRRDLIAKGAEISYDQIVKLAAKYGL
jgi:NTE family protein